MIEQFQNFRVPDCNIHHEQWHCIVSDKEKTDSCAHTRVTIIVQTGNTLFYFCFFILFQMDIPHVVLRVTLYTIIKLL